MTFLRIQANIAKKVTSEQGFFMAVQNNEMQSRDTLNHQKLLKVQKRGGNDSCNLHYVVP